MASDSSHIYPLCSAASIAQVRALRAEKRYEEACLVANQLIDRNERDADAWWNLGLAQHSLRKLQEAIDSLKTVVRLDPKFAPGWAQLGVVLDAIGEPEKGLDAIDHAIKLDSGYLFAARQGARISRAQKLLDNSIYYLQLVESSGEASGNDLNLMGIVHWEKKHFAKAIHYYHLSARTEPASAPYFNLALAYGHPNVSQDADAVDCLRIALSHNSQDDKATKRLDAILPRLSALAQKVTSEGSAFLDPSEWFSFYINPFELLSADRDAKLEIYDSKKIQLLKKRLLHEIELEDGKVSDIEGLKIDKSRAIQVCDDLNDQYLREFHWEVFKEPLLLYFLTRGDIRHFLVTDDYQPFRFISLVDEEWYGLREWISGPFSRQFDLVLTRAIQQKRQHAVEALLDGRRWILPEYEDACFTGSKRQVELLIEPFRKVAVSSKSEKLPASDVTDLRKLLSQSPVGPIINLLPEHFRTLQNEAATSLRDAAINVVNEHSDRELALELLTLTELLAFKDSSLVQQLSEDKATLKTLIAKEKEAEAHLSIDGKKINITKAGLRFGDKLVPSELLASVRWGVLVKHFNGVPYHHFLMVVRDRAGATTEIAWWTCDNVKKQTELYSSLVKAAGHYLIPHIIGMALGDLRSGKEIRVGKATLSTSGVSFSKLGWLGGKLHVIPWRNAQCSTENGSITIYDRSTPALRLEMVFRDTDNAFLLDMLSQAGGPPTP